MSTRRKLADLAVLTIAAPGLVALVAIAVAIDLLRGTNSPVLHRASMAVALDLALDRLRGTRSPEPIDDQQAWR